MDNFILFFAWTVLIGGACWTAGSGYTEKQVVNDCINVGSVTYRDVSLTCDPQFVRSNGKLIPWKEIPE